MCVCGCVRACVWVQEQLVAQLRASKAELTKKNKGMSQDEGRSLEEALLAAVTLEDYQAAAEVCLVAEGLIL